MSFIITCFVLAVVGFVLRALSPQQQQQNYRPSQFMQQPMQGPNYLGTALAMGAGVVAGNMVADAMASDDEPAATEAVEHQPVVDDQPVVEDEPVETDFDMGGFEF